MKRALLLSGTGLSLGLLAACGGDNNQQTSPPPAPPPAAPTAPVSGSTLFNLSCTGDGSGQQSAQFAIDQNASCSQTQPPLQQATPPQFNLNLDCSNRRLTVQSTGPDVKSATFPVQDNGSVQGNLNYLGQLPSDGAGHQACWVQYSVNFNGTASCVAPGLGQDSVALNTTVNLQGTTVSAVQQAGVTHQSGSIQEAGIVGQLDEPSPAPSPSPSASASPSPSPSPSASPSPSPSVTPTQTVTPLPTPTTTVTVVPTIVPVPVPVPIPPPPPSPVPTPTTTVTVTPIVVCAVTNPCGLSTTVGLSCG